MKAILKISFIIISFLMVTSCATVQPDLAKKYDFDKELEKATEIHSFHRRNPRRLL